METIRPRLIPCQKWAALKSLPYKMVRLDTFAFVEISVKERKIFLFVNRVRRCFSLSE